MEARAMNDKCWMMWFIDSAINMLRRWNVCSIAWNFKKKYIIVWQRFCEPSPDIGFPSVCVCLSVLSGIELSIYWSNFHATLRTVHCCGLVVHLLVWRCSVAPFMFWGGGGWGVLMFSLRLMDREVICFLCYHSRFICIKECTPTVGSTGPSATSKVQLSHLPHPGCCTQYLSYFI